MLIKAEVYVGSQFNRTVNEAIEICTAVNSPVPIPIDEWGKIANKNSLYKFSFESDHVEPPVGTLQFVFNGVTVSVRPDSNPNLIYRDWDRALKGYIEKNVGPYPNPVLTDEEYESDARVEAENDRRRQQQNAEYQDRAEAKHIRVTARMADAPPMEFSNKEIWDNALPQIAQSMYGSSITTYAERWARMMQLELQEGKALADIWESTLQEADLEGMSGYSQGIATHLLTQCWVHGAELRKLHNASCGSDSTEGTVNPAILILRPS